jgi:DNA-binding FadR family transcriptional regulator
LAAPRKVSSTDAVSWIHGASTRINQLAAADRAFQAEGDFTFHRTLVAAVGNAVMLGVFDGLHLPCGKQNRASVRLP